MPLAEPWSPPRLERFQVAAHELEALNQTLNLAATGLSKLNAHLARICGELVEMHKQVEHKFATKYDVLAEKFNHLAKLLDEARIREEALRALETLPKPEVPPRKKRSKNGRRKHLKKNKRR